MAVPVQVSVRLLQSVAPSSVPPMDNPEEQDLWRAQFGYRCETCYSITRLFFNNVGSVLETFAVNGRSARRSRLAGTYYGSRT